jgi:hypothetical protein
LYPPGNGNGNGKDFGNDNLVLTRPNERNLQGAFPGPSRIGTPQKAEGQHGQPGNMGSTAEIMRRKSYYQEHNIARRNNEKQNVYVYIKGRRWRHSKE